MPVEVIGCRLVEKTKLACSGEEAEVHYGISGGVIYVKCDYREGIVCNRLSNGHPVACFQYRNTKLGKILG